MPAWLAMVIGTSIIWSFGGVRAWLFRSDRMTREAAYLSRFEESEIAGSGRLAPVIVERWFGISKQVALLESLDETRVRLHRRNGGAAELPSLLSSEWSIRWFLGRTRVATRIIGGAAIRFQVRAASQASLPVKLRYQPFWKRLLSRSSASI